MKRTTNKLFLYSLTSLAVMGASAAYAEQLATAPTLEGGVTAMIGTWAAVPSADGQDYGVHNDNNGNVHVLEVNPDTSWGLDASLGYVFEDTANSIELNYRLLNTDDSDNQDTTGDDFIYSPLLDTRSDSAESSLTYELNGLDLMFNQFLDVGRSVQMRFAVGASYLNLEREKSSSFYNVDNESQADSLSVKENSDYSGIGPRAGVDARYDFGNGFGILGGGSVAYYVGDMDFKNTCSGVDSEGSIDTCGNLNGTPNEVSDDIDNHGVTNLRANVAIDYVYFMENEESTLGIELGYQFDYYADAIHELYLENGSAPELSDTHSVSFSGPYLNLKGAF